MPADVEQPTGHARHRRSQRALAALIALALAAVIVAPIALSSGDLIAWAGAPQGLGLTGWWPWVVFVALDAAAAVCVGFVVYSAWRGEPAGVFGLLVWVFAGGSALANWRHGQTTPAPDDAVFFAAMSLAGPVLLHVTVHRIRRWVRITEGEYVPARAHFGLRWLPGIAFRETLAAWKASVRAGISRPDVAIADMRERALLKALKTPEQVRYAVGAIGGAASVHQVRVWLADRGVLVDTQTLEETISIAATVLARTDRGPRERRDARPADAAPAAPTRAAAHRTARTDRLRERVAATYARLLADGHVTPATGAVRVAELIREHTPLPQSARTIERYVHEVRRGGGPGERAASNAAATGPVRTPAGGEGEGHPRSGHGQAVGGDLRPGQGGTPVLPAELGAASSNGETAGLDGMPAPAGGPAGLMHVAGLTPPAASTGLPKPPADRDGATDG